MIKRLILIVTLLVYLMTIPAAGIVADDIENTHSDPISKGTMNTTTNIYWGKSEAFPVMGMAYANQSFDVYEYNKDWVMVLYDTFLTQGNSGSSHSFFGYVKRSTITCDPALEGDDSPKADTGLGKKKGKKPPVPKKDKPKEDADESKDSKTKPEDPAPEEEPQIEVSTDEDYDWILRTPGLCTLSVPVEQATFTCSFSLIAQKAGGIGPSSDSGFNHGIRTPYAATAFFSMVSPMQDILDTTGMSQVLSGSGGVEIVGQAGGSTFYIDTASLDPALVQFSINLQATATLNPQVTDGNVTGSLNISASQNFPLPVQLKKSGGGYKFILKGMRPGGGDLEFPAVLEKTFSDPDRWDKAAKEADKKRQEAEKIRQKILEKLKKQVQDDWSKQSTTQTESLETEPLPQLAPLEPIKPEDNDATGDTPTSGDAEEDPVLAPLWPITDEAVQDFPSSK